ncbi:rod shape-determining protein MreC [Xenorhabdus stockiae]|uniref:Cell shape-determining protein MreC n=2 Tax=Morganellaceae TaxID=1903414 RepID=A0A2D0KPX7_9GAMM|nr:rod shape-determining protein MreC [Xenorhabdus stockiae]PHM70501.1 rod shape-determining protein MreC [Xenorhabdus sp. KJ12.1]
MFIGASLLFIQKCIVYDSFIVYDTKPLNNAQLMKPIFSRGPSLQLRLFFAVAIAIILVLVDSRFDFFHKVRSYMDTAVSPFYFLANGPRQFLDGISDSLTARKQLELENYSLRNELRLKDSKLLLLGQLKQENIRLRSLLGSPLRHDEHMMATQVIARGLDPYRDQIVIDKGAKDGVYEGQPVVSDRGVVGQVVSVSQLSSRVLLICDPIHALPVQVLRNDIRVIAGGTGCADDLHLEPLPSDTDIRVGDELVTSGLGGRFPEGYPVAVVSSVKIDNQRAHTVIHARPLAELRRLRYLLLVWGPDNNPSEPLPPSEVYRAANERMKQLLPYVLPNPADEKPHSLPEGSGGENSKKEDNKKKPVAGQPSSTTPSVNKPLATENN